MFLKPYFVAKISRLIIALGIMTGLFILLQFMTSQSVFSNSEIYYAHGSEDSEQPITQEDLDSLRQLDQIIPLKQPLETTQEIEQESSSLSTGDHNNPSSGIPIDASNIEDEVKPEEQPNPPSQEVESSNNWGQLAIVGLVVIILGSGIVFATIHFTKR